MMRSKRYGKLFSALVAAVLFLGVFPAVSFAEDFSAVVTAKGMNVYADASLQGKTVTLPKGTVVVVNEVSAGVAQITIKNKTVYCDYDSLTAVEDIAYKAYVNASGVRVYEKPDTSSKSVSVDKNTVVNLLAVSGSWALIEKNGYGAFMYKGYLTLVADEATPTPEPTGTPEDSEAPQATPTTAFKEVPAVVTSDTLTVYKSASTSSTVLGTLKSGAEVTALVWNDTWAYIVKDGYYGYCKRAGLAPADSVATADPTASPTPAPTATVDPANYIPAVVTADSVPVYASASTSSAKLGTLKKGADVNVVDFNSTWAYIEKGGYFGYCATSALQKATVEPTPTPAPSNVDKYRAKYPDIQFGATVVKDGTIAYTDPDDLSVFNTLPIATQVDVYAYNSNWAYIGIGDARGFVEVKYLNAAKYTEISSGSSGPDVGKLQAALEKLGYFDGTPGGNYSTLTAAAVKRFQAALGFSQTGTADVTMLRILYGGYAPESPMIAAGLATGNTGANVERLQTRLYYLGYLSKTSSIDGDYGSTTAAAVKLFQAQADLTADGIANASTLRAMYKNGAATLPSGKNPADYSSPSSPSSPNGVTTMPKALASTTSSLGSNASNAEKIEYVIYIAQNQLGKPYIYGTAGPNSFDCSGLTTYAFKKVNVTLGRSAYAHGYQASSGTKIESISSLKRGDIVCFDTIADSDLVDHVGIYLGDGYFIHASSGTSNGKQVCISSLSSGYYNRVFSWARRPLE